MWTAARTHGPHELTLEAALQEMADTVGMKQGHLVKFKDYLEKFKAGHPLN